MPDDTPSPDSNDTVQAENSYILPRSQKTLSPPTQPKTDNGVNAALNVIREKLAKIYADAPNPFEALQKPQAPGRTKHQQFMFDLQNSGRSLADIQTAWHNYYLALPDHEKHQVWQEFYEAHAAMRARPVAEPTHTTQRRPTAIPQALNTTPMTPIVVGGDDDRQPEQVRSAIRRTISANGKLQTRHHLQSLGFGLTIGVLTLVITLFSFFNEVIIAPFIQPGRAEGATPIIIDPSSVATGTTPEVIIPKINLEIPVDYSQTSDEESAIQNALEKGVVHYPSTVFPGQQGNAAYFGHSSNNIFNPGKYKFAFVLLHELQPGDTFYLTYRGKTYVYKVFKRLVVSPNQVEVLDNVPGHHATATLITCDPPGTALNRLVVVGDQISPEPAHDSKGSNTINTNSTVTALPDNGPTLWDRITSFLNL